MTNDITLQTILGTDKRNPVFTIAIDPSHPNRMQVFFGAELLETVPCDKEHPSFKLLIGRLFNAGVSRKALQEAFDVCYTTQARWGRALQEDDLEKVWRILAGAGAPHKLTPPVRAFVETIFPAIYAQDRYRYSAIIRKQIEEIFHKTISAETLRPLFGECKKRFSTDLPVPAPPLASEPSLAGCCDCPSQTTGPMLSQNRDVQRLLEVPPTHDELNDNRKDALISEVSPPDPAPPDVEPCMDPPTIEATPCDSVAGPDAFNHHGGVLLIAPVLWMVAQQLGMPMLQWMAAVMLGATNIERSKLLNGVDLKDLLGNWMFSLTNQRDMLKMLSTQEQIDQVYRLNWELFGSQDCRDFYYDPHTKHYTGAQKILKGWCGKMHSVVKVLHLDFVHTAQGHPVLQIPCDNFEDMRLRYPKVIKRLREVLGIGDHQALTTVADRGLYKTELLRDAAGTNNHLIIWEKDYTPEPWPVNVKTRGAFVVQKPRNDSHDLRTWRFEYLDRPWDNEPSIRQILVRAINPGESTIEVSILATDPERPAVDIIKLMFNRWIQENDFKYEDFHFGMLAITSYDSTPYSEIRQLVDDHLCKSGQQKGLEKMRDQLQDRLQALLLKRHLARRSGQAIDKQILDLTAQLRDLKKQIKQCQKEVSRLQEVIDGGFVRLKTHAKSLMDAIKILTRNAYWHLLGFFRPLYDNLRDDHAILRNLIVAPAWIHIDHDKVLVVLHPTMPYSPALREIILQFLDGLNAQNFRWLVDPNKTITFELSPSQSKRRGS